MTTNSIYLKLVQKECVRTSHRYEFYSEKADGTLIGKWTRTPELSKAKRAFGNTLSKEILEMTFPPGTDDDKIRSQIEQKIYEYVKVAETASGKARCDKGEYSKKFENLQFSLCKIKTRLVDHKLINTPLDDNPFNIVRYNAARYLCADILTPKKELLKKLKDNPKVSNSPEVAAGKEKIVKKLLATITDDELNSTSNDPGYPIRQAIRAVETAITENRLLVITHSQSQNVRFNVLLSMDVTTAKFDEGRLRDYLMKALVALKNLEKGLGEQKNTNQSPQLPRLSQSSSSMFKKPQAVPAKPIKIKPAETLKNKAKSTISYACSDDEEDAKPVEELKKKTKPTFSPPASDNDEPTEETEFDEESEGETYSR